MWLYYFSIFSHLQHWQFATLHKNDKVCQIGTKGAIQKIALRLLKFCKKAKFRQIWSHWLPSPINFKINEIVFGKLSAKKKFSNQFRNDDHNHYQFRNQFHTRGGGRPKLAESFNQLIIKPFSLNQLEFYFSKRW